MPIRTTRSKSGLKRIHKKRNKAVSGRRNMQARAVFGAPEETVTPGWRGLKEPLTPTTRKKPTGGARINKSGRRTKVLMPK
jgi:hypothetical protein